MSVSVLAALVHYSSVHFRLFTYRTASDAEHLVHPEILLNMKCLLNLTKRHVEADAGSGFRLQLPLVSWRSEVSGAIFE